MTNLLLLHTCIPYLCQGIRGFPCNVSQLIDERLTQVPADASGGHVTITCHFDQTGSTEVQVTPAAAAQPSSTASQTAEPPVDDLTDDFAAGDAAVQVPVRSSLMSCHQHCPSEQTSLCTNHINYLCRRHESQHLPEIPP